MGAYFMENKNIIIILIVIILVLAAAIGVTHGEVPTEQQNIFLILYMDLSNE